MSLQGHGANAWAAPDTTNTVAGKSRAYKPAAMVAHEGVSRDPLVRRSVVEGINYRFIVDAKMRQEGQSQLQHTPLTGD